MGDTARSWPPRADLDDREIERENETASWPPRTASSRSLPGREFPPTSRLVDREDDGLAGEEDTPLPGPLSVVQDMRFVRQSPKTTGEKIDFAIHGAYAMPDSVWRTANIVFAYVIAAPGHIVCDAIKWAFFDRLSRALLAVPVLIALLFVLNHVPVVQWLVPDQWDISTAFPHDVPAAPGTVELPIDAAAAGEG